MAIKAIQTVYKGYKFRSRLEARWAVFFDSCGYDWEYEPEGFDLGDGVYYLPDFRIQAKDSNGDFNTFWFEVKPSNKPLTESEKIKIKRFSEECSKDTSKLLGIYGDFIVLEGNPEPRFYDGEIMSGVNGSKWVLFPCYRDRPFFFCDDTFAEAVDSFSHCDDYLGPYIKARQARFEHGETPQ